MVPRREVPSSTMGWGRLWVMGCRIGCRAVERESIVTVKMDKVRCWWSFRSGEVFR